MTIAALSWELIKFDELLLWRSGFQKMNFKVALESKVTQKSKGLNRCVKSLQNVWIIHMQYPSG